MQKVLIFGAQGMAGHMISNYFSTLGKYEIFETIRGEKKSENQFQLDVLSRSDILNTIEQIAPDIVINCIGMLNQDAEINPDKAIYVNSYFPQFLAQNALKQNYKLIHISTDCVFSGDKGGYVENAIKDGKGFYATTKGLGEVTQNNTLTFRTSIICPEIKKNGIGLFDWFLNQHNQVKGYITAYWTGVTTYTLAQAIDQAIEVDLKGLYHLVNNEKISKYHLLKIIKNVYNKDIEIDSFEGYSVDKSLIDTRNDFDFQVPNYLSMIEEMHKWMLKNKKLYIKYF